MNNLRPRVAEATFLILLVDGRGNEKRQKHRQIIEVLDVLCDVYSKERCALIAALPVCLQCLKIAEAHDCETVTNCEADEECFTEQYITQEGHIFFDLGCKSKQICDAINKFGKRSLEQPLKRQSDGRITLCEECCIGESCNGKGCDSYSKFSNK
ncbi:hypothetical protein CHS0354_001534 [Potamilus streckersoni]|uniref:Uncharacterized protein n=1 Tax=Potamilus streckersoni TaxID=2493646 RepID=A0AAE0SMH6_9BIVA|nr:hypothetical protein CHS0354_001534 [Potamilus streckersoni]